MDKWAMLCKLMVEPFNGPNWRWERKLDGDRMKAVVMPGGGVTLTARSGADKTAQFPELQDIWLHGCTLDGEVVSAQGLPFQEWNQRRMNRRRDIAKFAAELPAMYKVFDILDFGGIPVASTTTLAGRRRLLEDNFNNSGHAELVEQYDDGVALFGRACEEKWEGIVGKDMTQAYAPGRRLWVKVKRWLEGEYWVIGFTAGTGRRSDRFGSLMLGEWDADTGDFRRVAECGTGMDEAELERLDSVRRGMRMELGHVVLKAWPTPAGPGAGLKVRVKYVEVTNAGSLRFPVYLGQVK